MKLLFELFPIVLFFASYQIWGIEIATAVAIVASIVQIVWLKFRKLNVSGMQWFSLAIIVVFGGLTLWLHDPWFIKLKPTILNLGFALVLVIAILVSEEISYRASWGHRSEWMRRAGVSSYGLGLLFLCLWPASIFGLLQTLVKPLGCNLNCSGIS